jgi:glucokinase
MLLAGDVGGTKTLLGLFERGERRPAPIEVRTFPTLEFPSLTSMIAMFLSAQPRTPAIEAACVGVAGPVLGHRAELTNVPWIVDADEVASTFSLRRVGLLNDLQSMAFAVPVLEEGELAPLQRGTPLPDANIGIIAAGTGLGEALLHNVEGRLIPSPSEGGHADFAARTPREIELLQALTSWYGRADVEHVVSGRGLVNLHRFVHADRPCSAMPPGTDTRDIPAILTSAALEQRCAGCVEALALFVSAYGAEAGNIALRGVTAGGVFVGGGIAPKILPALTTGEFVAAFRAKPPMDDWLQRVPVSVILNPRAALLGAAVFAAQHA